MFSISIKPEVIRGSTLPYFKVCLPIHWHVFNTLRPRQNGRHFANDLFKCIFVNENAWISLKISLKFVPKVQINNIPALVQIMAWRRPGDKPLFETMMVSLLTHICVTRPQWVNRTYTCSDTMEVDWLMIWWRHCMINLYNNIYPVEKLRVSMKGTL